MSKALRLGIFIFVTLLVFAAGVFLIGNRQFLFGGTYRLNAQFPNVAGLADGAEVRVAGVHEGTVRSIDLPTRPDGRVTVVMDLSRKTRDVIKKDSVAAIHSEGLVGDQYVEISFGSKDAPKVQSGDTIRSEAPLQVADLLKKTNDILNSAQGAVANIDQTTGNLTAISSKINQGKGTVGALINDQSVYQHVNAGATAFQENMEALKHNFLLRGFFRKRGYEDSEELTRHQIAQLPRAPAAKEFRYDASNLFDKSDSAKLKGQKTLNEAGKYLEANRFSLAVVAADTGMKGDSQDDRVLAEARAMVVRDYLVKNFRFDDKLVKTIGLGKTKDAGDSGGIEILVYRGEWNSMNSADRQAGR